MNTLIFMSSPNKKGNTNKLVEAFVKGLEGDVHIIYPYEEKIKPCIDCKYCYSVSGKCSIKDSMSFIYEKIDSADIIVIASPMYFASFSAPMKSIIDRLQVYWSKKYILGEATNRLNKKGLLFITAGTEWKDMFVSMEKITKYVFKTIGVEFIEGIYVSNTDKIKIAENKSILNKAYELGRYITKL